MNIKVVSNSTPLIALSKIGKFALLKDYFPEICIPRAVYIEVVDNGGNLYGARKVKEVDWIKVKEVGNQLAVKALKTSIDAGESEAVILATEIGADLLIIDDADGRQIAQGMGLKVTGTVGVLLMAAKDGKLDLKGALEHLRAEGFRLSQKEYQRILGLL